ncbi:MAG: DUF2141 domain-containing protein [Myxococcales bacterium]
MVWMKLARTALAAVTLASAFLLTGSAAQANDNDPAAHNTLTLKITGLKDGEKGKMACALFWENKGFPRKHRRALRRTWVDVDGQKVVECVFKRTGLGEYAASVFLDRNRNGKLDTNVIGGPKEPWGVSNNAKPKRFGPPAYKDATFRYKGGPVTIEIKLIYD